MKGPGERGFTLIELLIAVAVLALIAAAGSAFLSSALTAHRQGGNRADLYQEGLLAMERMTAGVRSCTYLLIPNAHKPSRTLLAFSGSVNDDNDFYFNDPLFPRIDEDPGADMNLDNQSGIHGVDDDGDGAVDEGGVTDDDEDQGFDEDPLDGLDNDGDGNIDEDLYSDVTADGKAGIAGMDDDGDGNVDEGNFMDDDEDGKFQEDKLNARVFAFDIATMTLRESYPQTGETVDISTRVTNFEALSGVSGSVLITLTLANEDGETVTFMEHVYPRNTLQRTGKRVR